MPFSGKMANNMIGKLKKIFLAEESKNSAEEVTAQNKDVLVETKEQIEDSSRLYSDSTSETRVCNVCKKSDIRIEYMDYYKMDSEGNKIDLFQHPKVDIFNGGIYDGNVAICDECFKECDEDTKKQQYVWINGKIDTIEEEITLKRNAIKENIQSIEEIKANALSQIDELMNKNAEMESEISELEVSIESYNSEQERLEMIIREGY